MLNKPKKTLYPNQEEVFKKFREFILPYLEKIPEVKEAVIWASLAEGKFGNYAQEFNGHTGSDVDMVLLLEEGKDVPQEFKDLQIHKSWFDGYLDKRFRHFDYNGHDHKVDVLLMRRKDMERAKSQLKGRSRFFILKKGVLGS